jgi:hypothetical protein
MRNPGPQRFVHVQVTLAELGFVWDGAEDVESYLDAKVTGLGWHPSDAHCFTPVRWQCNHDGAIDRVERQVYPKVGPTEVHRHLLRLVSEIT